MENKFGKDKLKFDINPDEAVAIGAAIQATLESLKNGDYVSEEVSKIAAQIKVSDVTSQALGVIATSSETGKEINSVIIPRNAKVPSKYTELFSTSVANQKSVNIQVTQGDDEDPVFVTIIGECELELPGNWAKGSTIKITFHYDIDQTVFVEVHDEYDKLIGQFEVERAANMNKQDLLISSRKIKELSID